MTNRISEPNTAADLANMSPQQRWALEQQRRLDPWTNPDVLITRDPATGRLVITERK
jgi:hypothetical protein